MSDYKNYSLNHLQDSVRDALESEATPQEVYDCIINEIQRSANYHRACLNSSSRLLSLLEDNIKIEGYDDFELPLPKQESNVVRISDRVKSWHPQRDGESFEECLAREGYEYTPIDSEDRSKFKLDSPELHNLSSNPYNDGWTQQHYKDAVDKLEKKLNTDGDIK